MSLPEETLERDQLACPWCLKIQSDPWELGDGGEGCGETECDTCERTFIWGRSFTVWYTGKPKKGGES